MTIRGGCSRRSLTIFGSCAAGALLYAPRFRNARLAGEASRLQTQYDPGPAEVLSRNLDTTKNTKHRDIPMGYLLEDLKRLTLGDPERYVFQIKTRPRWGRQENVCRDDRDLNEHFLRPAAIALGFHAKEFGFHSLRREAMTSIGSVLGIRQAMNVADQSEVDMALLYTLQDFDEQEKAIKAHQERIMGIPKEDLQ